MTAQFSEVLKYRGETLSLCSYPLNVYWKSSGNPIELKSTSTACWRGYVGTWEIKGDRLYLVKFWGHRKGESELAQVGLAEVFPGYAEGVFAHWFSGDLRCPQGKWLRYLGSRHDSQHERDQFISIRRGVVIGEREVLNGVAQEVDSLASGGMDDYVIPDFLKRKAD